MLSNAIKHFMCAKELRIATDNGLILLAVVRVEDKVTKNCKHTILGKGTLNHGQQRADTIGNLVSIICFVPRVIELIRREDATETGVGPVAYDREEAILHELRNITGIADGNLLPCIMDSGILFDCCFEFAYRNRDTVDEHKQVRTTQVFALNRVLIHDFENVVFRMIEVNIVHMKSHLADVVTHEIKALIDQPERFTISEVKRCGLNHDEFVDDLLHLNFAQSVLGITIRKERAQIIQEQNILILPVNAFSRHIGVLLLLKKLDYGMFQLIFSKLAFFKDIVHYGTSFQTAASSRDPLIRIGHKSLICAFRRSFSVLRSMYTS